MTPAGKTTFKKETNTNVLTDQHIEAIMQAFDNKADIEHFAQSVAVEKIAGNDYNLSVSGYVEPKDTREKVDIVQLNGELKTTVAKDRSICVADIDVIVVRRLKVRMQNEKEQND